LPRLQKQDARVDKVAPSFKMGEGSLLLTSAALPMTECAFAKIFEEHL
jgi:hypothetical protein